MVLSVLEIAVLYVSMKLKHKNQASCWGDKSLMRRRRRRRSTSVTRVGRRCQRTFPVSTLRQLEPPIWNDDNRLGLRLIVLQYALSTSTADA